MTAFDEIDTPVGPLLLFGGDDGLRGISFQAGPHPLAPPPEWRRSAEPFRGVVRELDAYFAGKAVRFESPLALRGTPFQLEVWSLLRTIPYGETTTYAEIARRLGRPSACRAVGAANGRNPVPIVIPCHRVVGADGSLTGFGGGLPIKRALLALEARRAPAGGLRLLPFDPAEVGT
jgi:methylated-DNA-[protein]-cysteine S-methyltransferase